MGWVPEALLPTPEPWFVRELKKIDPDLRVVFGYERYLVKRWAIERKIPPERYFLIYAHILESDGPRFVDQPVFDTDQPIYNDYGECIGYKQVGTRKFDLAPEYELVLHCDQLHNGILNELKRAYAWERNWPLSRLKIEQEREQAEKEAAMHKRNAEIAFEGVQEGWRKAGKIVQI